MTVVGVVGSSRFDDLAQDDGRGAVYFANMQPTSARMRMLRRDIRFVVRTEGSNGQMANAVRSAVLAIDPERPLYDVTAMETRVGDSLTGRRVPMTLVLVFAAIALLLALIGVYGVLAQSGSQRTREIGVRLALGAQRRLVMGQVLWRSVRLVLLGLTIGVVAALALGRLLESLLFGVEPADPVVCISMSAVLMLAAIGAGWIPSRRASRVNVVLALRAE